MALEKVETDTRTLNCKVIYSNAKDKALAEHEIDAEAARLGYYRVDNHANLKTEPPGKRLYMAACLPLPRKEKPK